jgi:hypothetical protein
MQLSNPCHLVANAESGISPVIVLMSETSKMVIKTTPGNKNGDKQKNKNDLESGFFQPANNCLWPGRCRCPRRVGRKATPH